MHLSSFDVSLTSHCLCFGQPYNTENGSLKQQNEELEEMLRNAQMQVHIIENGGGGAQQQQPPLQPPMHQQFAMPPQQQQQQVAQQQQPPQPQASPNENQEDTSINDNFNQNNNVQTPVMDIINNNNLLANPFAALGMMGGGPMMANPLAALGMIGGFDPNNPYAQALLQQVSSLCDICSLSSSV